MTLQPKSPTPKMTPESAPVRLRKLGLGHASHQTLSTLRISGRVTSLGPGDNAHETQYSDHGLNAKNRANRHKDTVDMWIIHEHHCAMIHD